jgi:uncharacterized protein YbaA (DUF1428 family)
MPYVDGFVIPLPKKNLATYRKMAQKAAKVWKEHGALEIRECVGDDLEIKDVFTFTKLAKTKPDETVVFSWITYKSRAHRDKVNAAVMKDPRMNALCGEGGEMPFDCKKMAYGGFKTIVDLS